MLKLLRKQLDRFSRNAVAGIADLLDINTVSALRTIAGHLRGWVER